MLLLNRYLPDYVFSSPPQISSCSSDLRPGRQLERRLLLKWASSIEIKTCGNRQLFCFIIMLQSNYQHKGADITTWHFIYLDTFYSEERETMCPKNIYNSEFKKGEDSVHMASQRTSHHAPLWGLALEGSGM